MASVAIIIPNYNYGQFVEEAVTSALEQRVAADEILIIDDGSTDGSHEVLEALQARHAGRLKVAFNEKNLGIVATFAKAVSLTKADYIAFLGADNRMRPDYVARCKAALDANPSAGVAYIDLVIFGPLAAVLAAKVGAERMENAETYAWRFCEPTLDAIAELPAKNFIDGNSMFRRTAYDAAGGFRASARAEDHDLFLRMVEAGFLLVHVPETLVEYRQHSREQANATQLVARQAKEYRAAYEDELARHAELSAELARVTALLDAARGMFPTGTPLEKAGTFLANVISPHRRVAIEYALDVARARARGEPAPPIPSALLTDETI